MDANNFPRVVTQPRTDREWNSRPLDRKSKFQRPIIGVHRHLLVFESELLGLGTWL